MALPKPESNKKWKEKWNRLQFSELKERCRKHQERLKKMTGFTETIIQGSSDFRASGLSDHDKIPMTGFIL